MPYALQTYVSTCEDAYINSMSISNSYVHEFSLGSLSSNIAEQLTRMEKLSSYAKLSYVLAH